MCWVALTVTAVTYPEVGCEANLAEAELRDTFMQTQFEISLDIVYIVDKNYMQLFPNPFKSTFYLIQLKDKIFDVKTFNFFLETIHKFWIWVQLLVEPHIQDKQCGFCPSCGTLEQLHTLSRVLVLVRRE